jgi:hypothetical protein
MELDRLSIKEVGHYAKGYGPYTKGDKQYPARKELGVKPKQTKFERIPRAFKPFTSSVAKQTSEQT